MRAILLLAVLAIGSGCDSGDLTFASVPWGSEADELRGMMAERGFAYVTVANDLGDHLYAGTYAGRRAVVVARMAGGRLAKVEIGLQPGDSGRHALFRSVRERLVEEYGAEGRMAAGGRAGAGGVPLSEAAGVEGRRSVWSRRTRGGESYLILEDRPDLAIVISFESPSWHEEFLRRRRR